jgi:hypothetical protein
LKRRKQQPADRLAGMARLNAEGRKHRTKETAMRFVTASVIIAPLMLTGALPAAAAPPVAADPPVRLAAASDSTADRDTYTLLARDAMQDWQRKLHDFDEKAEAKGHKAGNAAENDLHAAWTRTEAAGHKLQTASAEGWESAKVSFEKATHDLAEAWDKAQDK